MLPSCLRRRCYARLMPLFDMPPPPLLIRRRFRHAYAAMITLAAAAALRAMLMLMPRRCFRRHTMLRR